MATIGNAMLIGISSPYARRGLLWNNHQAHFGKPGNILVARAPTWVMNPNLPRDGEFIAGQYADDPVSAAAEFGAEFRSDLEAFVTLDAVKACVTAGVRERGAIGNVSYVAFVDPSGGSSDSFTLAIAHREGDRAVRPDRSINLGVGVDRGVRGERGVVQLLAVDRDQARVCLGYIKAMMEQPLLAQLVEAETAEAIERWS